jgi:sortase A
MKLRMTRPMSYSTRPNRFMRWSRDAFLTVGVLTLGYNGFVVLDSKLYQAVEASHFQQQLASARPPIAGAERVRDLPIPAPPRGVLGKIEITRIGLAAMIVEGTDERTLRRAVGHIPGTSLPGQRGNVAIAGHRDTFFRVLDNIRNDDEITLTTLHGTYRYLVDSTQVVAPEDTQVLDDSDDTILTLVTCYPFYFVGPAPKRFIVRAHKIPG